MGIAKWAALSRMPAGEQKRLQDQRLRTFVREHLYPFSPHYRALFDSQGIDPRGIRSVADLDGLPFSSKQDLLPTKEEPTKFRNFILQPNKDLIKKHWPLKKKVGLLMKGGAVAKEQLRREYYPIFATFTTGRSAAPVSFTYSRHDMDLLSETGARLFDVGGVPRDGRSVSMFPFAPHLAFWQTAVAGIEAGTFILSTGGGKAMGTAGNIRFIERMKAETVIGVPGYVYHCLREAHDRKSDFSSVNKIILGAEKITPAMRIKMTEFLQDMGAKDVTILGTYGFTEARMAFMECPAPEGKSTGYHLYPDLCVIEIIDPETGKVLPEGQDGEIVFTPLAGRGSCVFRYRTGDLVEGGLHWDPCPQCGRTVPRISSTISRVSNRKDLQLTKVRGTLVSLDEFASVLGEFPEIEEWQLELGKKNDDPMGLDEMRLALALCEGTDADKTKKAIRDRMQAVIEVAPNRIEVLPLQDILQRLGMESEMKEKRFVDKRK